MRDLYIRLLFATSRMDFQKGIAVSAHWWSKMYQRHSYAVVTALYHSITGEYLSSVPARSGKEGRCMRINVYSQELTREVSLVSKASQDGRVHRGVRIFFEGSPRLHQAPDDDDRSAITFWLPDCGSFTAAELAAVFESCAQLCAGL